MAAHGAQVVAEPLTGKGEAMRAGVDATDAEVIVFLDADLVGLRPDHVDALVRAVRDGAGMACGLFDRGPLQPYVRARPSRPDRRSGPCAGTCSTRSTRCSCGVTGSRPG